jgi:hypothetical protein
MVKSSGMRSFWECHHRLVGTLQGEIETHGAKHHGWEIITSELVKVADLQNNNQYVGVE